MRKGLICFKYIRKPSIPLLHQDIYSKLTKFINIIEAGYLLMGSLTASQQNVSWDSSRDTWHEIKIRFKPSQANLANLVINLIFLYLQELHRPIAAYYYSPRVNIEVLAISAAYIGHKWSQGQIVQERLHAMPMDLLKTSLRISHLSYHKWYNRE